MVPYIGVTGFTKLNEVQSALNAFPPTSNAFPYCVGRQLMVGVLATWKSLRGIPMKPKWAKQTADPNSIRDLFLDDRRVVNLVHYSTEEGQEDSLLSDMLKIHELAGPNFHGLQLNVAWPPWKALSEYRYRVGESCRRIVLQVSQKAVEMAGGTPERVAEKVCLYIGLIDDVLLDPSGGQGKPFGINHAREFLSAVAYGWGIGLGIAGGLGPDSLDLVEPLIQEFPDLNIDAQGRLRNAENDLDPNLVSAYLTKALQLFSK